MNQKEQSAPAPEAKPPAEVIAGAKESPEFGDWLEHFYKECGREVTLAYTTLNQMKNWAMLIVAAVVSAVVAMKKSPTNSSADDLPVYVGALVAYVFTLRFFVRAILCYINLSRWNNLQSAIVAYKVAQSSSNAPPKTQDELKAKVLMQIDELYFGWHSPRGLSRGTQLLANLKLGFGLLLALPLFFAAVVGLRMFPFSHLMLAITTFAAGYTLVEFVDFYFSSFFDTPDVYAERKTRRTGSVFPTPTLGVRYLLLSILNVLVSVTVGLWPEIVAVVRQLFNCH